ncbi:MAG: DUF3313 domain-containing protein [Gammaproteobacteria bacterium]|nr:DUF3313 domain-containing protein [Gammaproteobacteria bacterium]
MNNKQHVWPVKLMLTVSVMLLGACTTTPPTVDTDAAAEEMSFDGLYPVKNTRVDQAWAREDLDLSSYSRFMIQGAGIQYRPVKSSGYSRARSGAGEFPLDLKQKQQLRQALAEAFLDELGKSDRLELVNEPGPDVLIVKGALLDVVSKVPPEPIGRGGVYLDSIGEATLLIELIDSESNAVLVRALDRRAAEQQGIMMESSSVTNWAEVKRLARSWARLLRGRLEGILDNLSIGTTG